MGDHHETIELDEHHQVRRSGNLPQGAFEMIEGTPVKLENLARMRNLNVLPPHLQGRQKRPRRDDRVKLGFVVEDAIAPKVLKEFSEIRCPVQTENMWVEVTSIRGMYPNNVFRGELMNKPLRHLPAKPIASSNASSNSPLCSANSLDDNPVSVASYWRAFQI
jgi:hypothetical protein